MTVRFIAITVSNYQVGRVVLIGRVVEWVAADLPVANVERAGALIWLGLAPASDCVGRRRPAFGGFLGFFPSITVLFSYTTGKVTYSKFF